MAGEEPDTHLTAHLLFQFFPGVSSPKLPSGPPPHSAPPGPEVCCPLMDSETSVIEEYRPAKWLSWLIYGEGLLSSQWALTRGGVPRIFSGNWNPPDARPRKCRLDFGAVCVREELHLA